MQLSPRYDGPAILDIDGLGDPSAPLVRQRERFVAMLGGLSDEQWAAPSRCALWSVKDVVSHLIGTDRFWAISFAAAQRGEPTRFLATFDPVASPEQMVDGMRTLPADQVLEQYVANVEGFLATVAAVTDWSLPAEAPPGHLPSNVTALHALWDSWVHERDAALPLGLAPPEEPDEIGAILKYAAALSPALYAAKGSGQQGTLVVEATEPDLVFTVEIGELVRVHPGVVTDGPSLRGRAVELIEGLSHRGPLPNDLAPENQWLLVGLAEVFDVA
jgi:uncharacterized protein (TIGR03083 family)